MTTRQLVQELQQMSNADREVVMQAAARLIRDGSAIPLPARDDDDPLLRVAGCLTGEPILASEIDDELYSRT